MNITKLDIQLDKDGCTYEPDEEVSGQVLMRLENPQSARGLKIKIEGRCDVEWVRDKKVGDLSGRMKTRPVTVRGSELYLDRTEYLIGSEDGPKMKIPAGEQSYPFRFRLPRKIPNSFVDAYGRVMYFLKAVVDGPYRADHEVTKGFIVMSKFDLNTVRGAENEVHDEHTLSFSNMFCCSLGEMDVKVTFPVRGYVPGQTIKAKVCFDNRSEVEIEEIKLDFIQMMTYKAPRYNAKMVETEILENKTLHGTFGQSGEYDMSILVQSVPASYFPYCKLIDIDYELKITFVICNSKISSNYPIAIGTIPLKSTQSDLSTASVPVEATEPIAPYPPGPEVPIAPYPPEPEVPIAQYPPEPEVPIAPYPPEPEVPIAPYPPEPEVPSAPYPPGPTDRPIPIKCQPMPQNYKLGFENYKPGAGGPVTGMPFVVPVPGPRTQPIGFVVSQKFPPPSYEECNRESHPVDQKQEPNSDADVKQPLIPPYPLDNLPYKNN